MCGCACGLKKRLVGACAHYQNVCNVRACAAKKPRTLKVCCVVTSNCKWKKGPEEGTNFCGLFRISELKNRLFRVHKHLFMITTVQAEQILDYTMKITFWCRL